MPTRRQFLFLAVNGAAAAGGVALLSGCRAEASDPDAPPSIQFGAESCAYCTMSIDDPRFAAGWRAPGGADRHFDDIGCMVNAIRREATSAETRFWVHDYQDQRWLDATSATFVISRQVKTPMGYGVAAFSRGSGAASTIAAMSLDIATMDWGGALQAIERKG